jgi:hypothetical protein
MEYSLAHDKLYWCKAVGAIAMNTVGLTEYFNTPILFIIFNDPVKTRNTFEQIKKIKPQSLYLAADGPRQGKAGEEERCFETRKILDEISWECEVKTLFKSENSGSAGLGVFSAIEWFFGHVEEGIVLEYDVVPHLDFFYFCQELLIKYRNNENIMVVGGSNFQDEISRSDSSYYFSSLPTLWGFATWRRAFKKFELNVNKIKYSEFCNVIPYRANKKITRYWRWKFYCMTQGRIETWDYPILFAIWINNGIGIISNKNLVTHFVDSSGYAENFNSHIPGLTNVPSLSILPLSFQSTIKVNIDADMYLTKKFNLELSFFQLIYNYLREFVIPLSLVSFLKSIKFEAKEY